MRIITGRAASGKTARILAEIAAACGEPGSRQLLIVPELFSHEYERRLAKATGNRGARSAEVLSFSRLALRVFAEAGGLAETVLTPAGRLLTLREALSRVRTQLDVCRPALEQPEILRELLTMVDELKTCRVQPEELFRAAGDGKKEDETLSRKLKELAVVYTAYDRLCAESLPDPRDRLTLLADRLPASGVLQNACVYIDCFASFTPQEMEVIRVMVENGVDLTVAVLCDLKEKEVFVSGCKTVARLRKMASRRGLPCEIVPCGESRIEKPADLSVIEREALLPLSRTYPSDGDSVRIFEAASPFGECEHAAAYIRKTVRETGARWRDFAVVARSMDGYAAPLQMAMARYDVPIFLAEKADLLAKPALALVTGAMDACAGFWRYEDLFACFKTGLCGLKPDEIDRLENYVLTWRVRGGAWEREWTGHPSGYGIPFNDASRAELESLNELRASAITPFVSLREALKQAETGGACVKALYAFLEGMDVPQAMERRAARHEAAGRFQLAEEYRQLWEILLSALEQFYWTAGGRPMTGGEFARLLPLVLGEYDVGTIPVSLDRVSCGEIDRVCTGVSVPHLILLGANDGLLPKTPSSRGLLSDADRELLEGLGVELAASGTERLMMEQETLYHAVACPRVRLLVSYATHDAAGKEARPSYFVGTLRRLLSGVPFAFGQEPVQRDRLEAGRPAFELAAAYLCGSRAPAVRAAYEAYQNDERLLAAQDTFRARGPLTDPCTIDGLYGESVSLAASRIDQFYSCQFAFFMKYGLKAQPRRRAQFSAPETGTFIHYVLENCLQLLGGEEGGAAAADERAVRAALRKVVQQYIDEELGGLEDKNARFRYLFNRLVSSVGKILDGVLEEMRKSDFAPIDYELDFSRDGDLPPVSAEEDGVSVSLIGKVDRVDGYIQNQRLYIRVMDYKSGKKSFSLSDIWYGLNMQLVIYLHAIQEKGLDRYRERLSESLDEIVPAGVLYVPTRDELPDADRAVTEEGLEEMRAKALRRSGLLSDDMDILEAMEHGLADKTKFIPVSLKKAKKKGDEPEFTAQSAVANLAKFGRLARYTQKKLLEMGRELRHGACAANPYQYGGRDFCEWCDYRAACRFDETAGDKKRMLRAVKDEEFWEKIGGAAHVDE